MLTTEIAFVLDPEAGPMAVLETLAARFACREGASRVERAVFYDTFDGRLHRKGSSLCAREEDSGWRLSWGNGGGVAREERISEPISFAADLPAGRLREVLEPVVEMRRLLPLVEVEHRGPALDLVDDEEKTVVRVRFEEGRARAPRERSAWHELPQVVKVVPVRGYEREYQVLIDVLSLVPELSRIAAGPLDIALAAIGGAPSVGRLSPSPKLDPHVRADEGLKRVHGALFEILRANEGGVRESLDTEFLHDFRVGVRRTRTLLGQLKEVFPAPTVRHFRAEFEWLAGTTGATRDLDVLLLDLDSRAEGQSEDDVAPLREFLRDRRADAQLEIVAALDSPRYAELIGGWRRFLDEPVLPLPPQRNAARSLSLVAGDRIRNLYRRARRRGKELHADSPVGDLHRLRLDCKKLRYVLDATKTLFEGERVEPILAVLKRLQDDLGVFNDCSVQAEKLREFGHLMARKGRAPVGTLFAMGSIVERTGARARDARSAIHARLRDFSSPKTKKRVRKLCEGPPPEPAFLE